MKHIIGVAPTGDAAAVQTLVVDADDAGQRLDNYLFRRLKGVPKTHVYRIIRSGEVRVNRARAGVEQRLVAGDAVRLPPVRTSERARVKAQVLAGTGVEGSDRPAPPRGFPILLEDDHLLAIDKPAGVAVHGGSGVSFGVIEHLRAARPQARFLELVHRLDRETSGVLLLAKKRSALVRLQEQFRARDTGKTYLALVNGRWPARLKVLDSPLRKYLLSDGERRVAVVRREDPDAMSAVTLVKVRAASERHSLLEVTIRTGRTHQIRVHLADRGHPIVGDSKYGDFALNHGLRKSGPEPGLARMFLHAWRLQFHHPVSGEAVPLTAALPPELQQYLAHVLPDASAE